MEEKLDCENGKNFNFEGLMSLTLGQVTLHTLMQQSVITSYAPNFVRITQPIENLLWTDKRMYIRMADRLY